MDSPDTFRILITTDNHVGYQENDAVRSDDAWKTFEEIMYIARDRDVDFVLQAGDLFHTNKPSKKSMFHVMKTLRTVCLGPRPVEFELLSDPSAAIDNRGLNHANFQDPNLNVAVPLFAIAGNHDDSTGDELLDPMDLLSVGGLINHFGKNLENDRVAVAPLLLQKGRSKLALYGLSNIRDERLYKTFLDGNVTFLRAAGAHRDSFFNLLAVHQNHAAHTDTGYLPESFLPAFLDFTVWGHEHECVPYTTPAPNGGVVLQPGSSVATSLCPAEMARKHVFVLSVTGKRHSVEAVPLTTARPFKMKTVDLTASGIIQGPGNQAEVAAYLTEQIEQLIQDCQDEWVASQGADHGAAADTPEALQALRSRAPLPLIRLKVEYVDGFEIENPRRFSNRFVGQVANVNDVVSFHRKKNANPVAKKPRRTHDAPVEDPDLKDSNVTTLIDSFLQEDDLNLISKNDITAAIQVFVEKEDKNALKDFVKRELDKDFEELLKLDVEDAGVDHEDSVARLKSGFKDILKEMSKERKAAAKVASTSHVAASSGSASDDNSVPSPATPPPAVRRNTRKTRTRQVRSAPVVDSEDEVFSDPEPQMVVSDGDDDDFRSDEDADFAPPPPPAPRSTQKPASTHKSAATKVSKSRSAPKPAPSSQNVMDLVKKMASKR